MPQMGTRPVQGCPADVAVPTIAALPLRFAICRSTENDPLGGRVVREPRNTCVPLSVMRTAQLWPDLLLSTSNSTSRRPSSGLAFSFHVAPDEQEPRFTIPSS